MLIFLTLLVFAIAYLAFCFRIVQQTDLVVIETLGKYSRTQEAGWTFVYMPFQQTVAKLNTQIATLHDTVSVKTKDSQFVALPTTVMFQIDDPFKAHYTLSEPRSTINTLVLNIIRPTVSQMSLEELFSDREKLKKQIEVELSLLLKSYGYLLVNVLVDQPALSKEAEKTFNDVLLAEKRKQAAVFEADAQRIKVEAQASAEAEAQRLRAQGLADSRRILASSLKESLDDLSVLERSEAINLLLETNRIDALRTMAGESNNLIILDTHREAPVIINSNKHVS